MVRAASPCPVTRRPCSEATVGPSRCEQPRFGESTQEIRDAWGALRRSRRHRAGTDAMDPPAGDPSLLSSSREARDTGVQIHLQKCRFRARGPAMAEALQRADRRARSAPLLHAHDSKPKTSACRPRKPPAWAQSEHPGPLRQAFGQATPIQGCDARSLLQKSADSPGPSHQRPKTLEMTEIWPPRGTTAHVGALLTSSVDLRDRS